jgi:T4 RnlA family RNA ligase
MQTVYGRDLYNDLMFLVSEENSPFYYVDHVMNGVTFRVFSYRLASYSDYIKPSGLECRGHMFEIDANGNYVRLAALPPAKFFNFRENPLVMDVDFAKTELIMDKMDGSIMTTYNLPIADVVALKSKTSLMSEQAVAANAYLQSDECYALFNYLMYMMQSGYSVSLEWTSPVYPFRIVIPYEKPALTVLCARDLNNGQYVPYSVLEHDMEEFGCGRMLVKDYLQSIEPCRVQDFINNIRYMKDIEGYVIFADGIYTKHKTDWYCSLHHTKDSVNSDRRLFEVIVNEAHDDLRAMFSDDKYVLGRIDEMEQKVKDMYHQIDTIPVKFYNDNLHLSRKDFAIKATAEVPKIYFGIAMNLYVGKEVKYQEWLLKHWKDFGIKDDAEAPQTNDDEG